MAALRTILLANYKNGNADRIKSRWCSGDSPGLFKERWEKLFEDWVVSLTHCPHVFNAESS